MTDTLHDQAVKLLELHDSSDTTWYDYEEFATEHAPALAAALLRLEEALEGIAGLYGHKLLEPGDDPTAASPYNLGSAAAFDQAAMLARAALRSLGEPATERKGE